MDVLWLTLDVREAFLQYASLHASFSYKQHFYKQHQANIGKNQANGKQHPEAELSTSENYLHSPSTLSSNNNRTYSKKKQKNKYVCIHEIMQLITTKMKTRMKIDSRKCGINRSRCR